MIGQTEYVVRQATGESSNASAYSKRGHRVLSLSTAAAAFVLAVTAGQAQNGPGYALNFSGTSNLMFIGSTPLSPPWTAEFWVNRQDSPSWSSVLLVDSATALKLEQYNFTRKVGFTQFGTADYTFNYSAPTNTWVHLAFVSMTTNTQLFVNGVLQDTIAASIALPLEQLGSDVQGDQLKGTVDEIRVWKLARSQSDIQANMNHSLSLPQAGLMAYWRFDEGKGTNAFDSSGQGLSGILANGPTWVVSTVPFGPAITTQAATGISSYSATKLGIERSS
jgi:hypothetical protein